MNYIYIYIYCIYVREVKETPIQFWIFPRAGIVSFICAGIVSFFRAGLGVIPAPNIKMMVLGACRGLQTQPPV